MEILDLFTIALVTILIGLAATPASIWLARKINLVDFPNTAYHKRHTQPVPIAGGILLFTVFLITSLVMNAWHSWQQIGMLLSFAIVFLFGLLDDRFGFRAEYKLVGQVLASIVLITSGFQVRLVPSEIINLAITVFWLVGITNAFNFVDSMDGLAVGLGALTSAFFVLVTLQSQQPFLTLLSTIMLAACLVGYFFNASPARLFLGDSGAQLLGFFLATVGMVYTPLGFERITSWFVPILLLGVPIFDTCLVVFSRLRRRLPVYQGNLDHTYHRLTYRGVSRNRAILTMHMTATILNCLAFVALHSEPVVANLIFSAVLVLGAVCLVFLERTAIDSAEHPDTSHPAAPTSPQPPTTQ